MYIEYIEVSTLKRYPILLCLELPITNQDSGAILEIAIREAVFAQTWFAFFQPRLSSYTHEQSESLLKKVYLLYFVQKITLKNQVR